MHRGAGAYICGEETGAAQLARRQARRAASEAAVPGDRRSLRRCRRSSTTSRRSRICVPILRTRRGVVRGGRHRAQQGLQDRLGLRSRAQARATTRFRSARRCARSSSLPAACARDARSWRCSPAAVRRRASSRSTSTCRTTTRAWRRPARCSARARSSSSTTRPTSSSAAHNLVRFFAHESCGQCTPCREGGSGWNACSSGWCTAAASPATTRCCCASPARSPA